MTELLIHLLLIVCYFSTLAARESSHLELKVMTKVT